MKDGKIESFTDLNVWKEGHKLVMMIYAVTKLFPKEELFGLVSQMRRSAVSITSNVAEGFSRQSYKEKVQFYYTSLGSLTEIQNQLLIAKDLEYVSKSTFSTLADQTINISKLLNGLIRSIKSNNK